MTLDDSIKSKVEAKRNDKEFWVKSLKFKPSQSILKS